MVVSIPNTRPLQNHNTYSRPNLKRDIANCPIHRKSPPTMVSHQFVYTNMPEKPSSTHIYDHGIVSPLSPPATRNASPTPARQARSHARATYEWWRRLTSILEGGQIVLDGESLDVPALVAVAKFVFCMLLCIKPHC